MGEHVDTQLENLRKEDFDLFQEIRRAGFKRALKILENPKIEIPPGQLLAFVAKVGAEYSDSRDNSDKPKIERQTNILAILPGLPPERAKQIVQQFEKELDVAKRALET